MLYTIKENTLFINTKDYNFSFKNVASATDKKGSLNGLSEEFTEIMADGENKRSFIVFNDLSLVFMPSFCEEELFSLDSEHYVLTTVKLNAFTDEIDTLVEENEYHIFYKKLVKEKHGEIFLLKNYENNTAFVIISETPDAFLTTLNIVDGVVKISNGGNGVAVGFCKIDECENLVKAYYFKARKPKTLVTMSNTWGDRNGISRICRDFALKEVDAAKEIGVDIVQIDDGWQIGKTYDTSKWDAQNRPVFSGDYWTLDEKLFPGGLNEITEYAKASDIKMGIWFAPDAHDDYALFDRDVAVLKKAYTEWGVRFFKLDMFWITNLVERDKFLALLKEIYSFGPDVAVQLDVTRFNRINYFCGKEYGTLFVENRYTKGGTYYPHRTLKNIWMLSKYLPTQKFQFELANPDLNGSFYKETDEFAPKNYSMDYLFAVCMLSNPLFWMEMQFLSTERKTELKRIMPIWKELKEELSSAKVTPILEKPTGRSISGFKVEVEGKEKYLLVFRESTNKDTARIETASENYSVLASNNEVLLNKHGGMLTVKFTEKRSYALIKL